MYRQVLAFNPDECDTAGGKVTPSFAMGYAREYVSTYYPNQEAVWVLHREHCAADGTDRYAVHIAINRSDIETGRRLSQGKSAHAKVERANMVRDLDRKHGLRQMVAGKRNSLVHARQPCRAEKEMGRRGVRSDKRYVREAVRASVAEARSSARPDRTKAFAEALEAKGVAGSLGESGRDLVFERKKTGRKMSGAKLGRGYSMGGIAAGLGVRIGLTLLEEAFEEGIGG